MSTTEYPTHQDAFVEGFLIGQLQALTNLIGQTQRTLTCHDYTEAVLALTEAQYAVNRASKALTGCVATPEVPHVS
jgi:hypothetical protein